MKAFLMYQDQDFDLQRKLPWTEQALTQDLELTTLFDAMGLGDKFIWDVVRRVVLLSLDDVGTVLYRQDILEDCLKNPAIVRDLYAIAVEAIESERKVWWSFFRDSPHAILQRSVEVLELLVRQLKRLKIIADQHAQEFASAGFTALFAMLKAELGDEYFALVEGHLRELKFQGGALISAELGKGNKGTDYRLRKRPEKKQTWMERMFARKPPAYTYHLPERDESGPRYLAGLQDRGINLVANALAQSTDHILSFFTMLRTELAFYVGCVNLHEQLAQLGEPTCFPVPVAPGERRHSYRGLYDVCLALSMKQRVVGNDGDADRRDLVMITGANQGGKSVFLRSIGLAQLMMQCGMFVPAEAFCANICVGLFTHYKREEDTTMQSGKFDEELSRMSEIVEHITSNAMLLFNESFAATNEREGSEIARQIVGALLEKRIKVFFVTHLYEFAHGFFAKRMENAIFLRAERQADGARTFKLLEGEPLQTSYGEDLYQSIFGIDKEGEP
jgi:DNA mismatch repair ATPase MutS